MLAVALFNWHLALEEVEVVAGAFYPWEVEEVLEAYSELPLLLGVDQLVEAEANLKQAVEGEVQELFTIVVTTDYFKLAITKSTIVIHFQNMKSQICLSNLHYQFELLL